MEDERPGQLKAARLLVKRACRHRRAGQREQAEQLVKLQPDRDSYQLLLGDAYALRGSRDEAEQAWQAAKRLGSKTARKRLAGGS